MCLIIHREPGPTGRGSNVPNEVIAYNAKLNPDGFGIAWRETDGELKSAKFAPKEFESFRDLLKNIDRDAAIEYVAHFRKATHGPACERLSHPFNYEDPKDGKVLVFHNGIISIDTEQHESDTSAFVDRILSALKPRWWTDMALRYLVEEAIGWSKIVLMTASETVRLNSRLGKTYNGIWYSTEPYPYTSTKGSTWKAPDKAVTAQALLPATVDSSAKDSSGAIGPEDDTESDDPTEYVLKWPDNVEISDDDQWVSRGHVVSPLGDAKKDNIGDTYGTAVCENCHTIGDYYLIDGRAYLDVAHIEDDPDDLDPVIQQALMDMEYRSEYGVRVA